MPTCKTPDERIDALARNLRVATDLIGPDIADTNAVHSEYIRALTEQTCSASGISTNHKGAIESLFVGILTND